MDILLTREVERQVADTVHVFGGQCGVLVAYSFCNKRPFKCSAQTSLCSHILGAVQGMCFALFQGMFVCLGREICEKHLYQWQTAESSFLCYRLLGNWIEPPEKCCPTPSPRTCRWHTLGRQWGWGGEPEALWEWAAIPIPCIVCSILRGSLHAATEDMLGPPWKKY